MVLMAGPPTGLDWLLVQLVPSVCSAPSHTQNLISAVPQAIA